jgi:aquaporin Z
MSADVGARQRFAEWFAIDVVHPIEDFRDPKQEWRRLFSELLGTFFLVLVAAGGGMMSQAFPDTISRTAAVTAPGLMVLAIILFMGKVSGAHLNPAVSLAFAARGDFPWRRVPGTSWAVGRRDPGMSLPAGGRRRLGRLRIQLSRRRLLGRLGVLDGVHPHRRPGERDPGDGVGAQNMGIVGAFGVGAYIALAGLWGSPISGTSMTPARTFGPDLVGADFSAYWVYLAGPIAGGAAAVLCGFVLRGRGGGKAGSGAAQGALDTEFTEPDKA